MEAVLVGYVCDGLSVAFVVDVVVASSDHDYVLRLVLLVGHRLEFSSFFALDTVFGFEAKNKTVVIAGDAMDYNDTSARPADSDGFADCLKLNGSRPATPRRSRVRRVKFIAV